MVQVVKGKPIASHNAVLLAHGNAGNFNSDFMAGTYSPQSLFVYLASNGIDVWGIDYGWALVPASETNFTFMQNWGLQRDIDDLEAALLFARVVRATTGSDGGRLALLGFSNSVWTGYSLLNEETQISCPLRQVRVDVLDAFRASRGLSLIAGAKELELLRQFFKFCLVRHWVRENPAAQIKGPRNIQPNEVEPYTPAEVESMIIACDRFGRSDYERLRARAMVLTSSSQPMSFLARPPAQAF